MRRLPSSSPDGETKLCTAAKRVGPDVYEGNTQTHLKTTYCCCVEIHTWQQLVEKAARPKKREAQVTTATKPFRQKLDFRVDRGSNCLRLSHEAPTK